MRNEEGRRRLLLGILGTFIAAAVLRCVPSMVLIPALTESGVVQANSGWYVFVTSVLFVLAEISVVACGVQIAVLIVGWSRLTGDDLEW